MANGEVIKQVRELLSDPKSMTSKTAQIMTLTLLSELYEKWEEDHKKIEEMYPYVKEQRESGLSYKRGAVGLAITSILLWVFHVVSQVLGL